MARRRIILGWCLVLFGLAGCEDEVKVETCAEDIMCYGVDQSPGRCLYDGSGGWYCAAPAFGCPTGYRWFIDADPKIARTCVTQAMLEKQPPPDGGAPADMSLPQTDAPPPGAR